MTQSTTTLTMRLSRDLKSRLGTLAEQTNRSKSYLATAAIEDYVARELAIIEGIERGLDDMRAGRVIPHEEVMADIRQIIAEARAEKDYT